MFWKGAIVTKRAMMVQEFLENFQTASVAEIILTPQRIFSNLTQLLLLMDAYHYSKGNAVMVASLV
uniref:Uncharacterized protein n=1 Tax=Cannabis sativa TaxID=3483 RepID=A0A803R5D1_CANSA